MELQVFVPVPADRLREALADAVRVARAVPGLQQDAGAAPVAGRLKLRVGGHSVTYRGTLAVSARADGTYAVRADGTESRGAGTVTLSLTLALLPTEGGTTVTVGGTAKADGRLAELPADAVTTAANRLLTRTLETLAAGPAEGTGSVQGASGDTGSGQAEPKSTGPGQSAAEATEAGQQAEAEAATQAQAEGATEPGQPGQGDAAGPGPRSADKAVGPEQVEGDSAEPGQRAEGKSSGPEQAEDASEPEQQAEAEAGRQADAEPGDDQPTPPPPSVFDTDVPPPSLDPETDAAIPDTVPDGLEVRAEPPAEAAHARRTMIGRSAEEVDHAPPRGRYAPVPAPQTVTANPALRWAAPAAAVAVASAIVVARALRKRH
ncbi:SRPBCC domain-containing protein [Streptomyces bauhiniae]|uniref:SRPBCC domain-containing protein n=1 Tax=Streptomyces bauhiniae TaxID=2340725 RepID=UPI003452BC04